jgi:hypothetical protein
LDASASLFIEVLRASDEDFAGRFKIQNDSGADLVREGLFHDYSERGVWELSEKGKSLVREMERSTD